MNKDDLTPNGDGNSEPDTDTNANTDSDTQDKTEGSQTSNPTISEARLRANRENAKKSTGPKTARGKAYSRFNALKHGLVSKKIIFTPDGKLQDEGLLELLESLRDKYGRGDVRTELLVEGIVIEYWRSGQALQIEKRCITWGDSTFLPGGRMANVQRYRTASDRSLRKNLELLDKLQPPSAEADVEQHDAEADAPAPQLETPPQAPKPTSSLTVVLAEPGAPVPCSDAENGSASGEDSTPPGEIKEAA